MANKKRLGSDGERLMQSVAERGYPVDYTGTKQGETEVLNYLIGAYLLSASFCVLINEL